MAGKIRTYDCQGRGGLKRVERYLRQEEGGPEPWESVLGQFRPVRGEPLKPHDRDYADTLR